MAIRIPARLVKPTIQTQPKAVLRQGCVILLSEFYGKIRADSNRKKKFTSAINLKLKLKHPNQSWEISVIPVFFIWLFRFICL